MHVSVIGAGSWGTTLANLLARNHHAVRLWAFEPAVVAGINDGHVNDMYLEGCPLSPNVLATGDVGEAVNQCDLLVSAPPSHAVRVLAEQVAANLGKATPTVVSVSKGLEPGTFKTMTDVLDEVLPGCPVVALSGPSFAREVYGGMPTAVVAASRTDGAATLTQSAFATDYFRVYTSRDTLGVQLGGALKNVVAIAAGILEGLGMGFNPRAALLTRALAEMTRLGEALGAEPRTFAGLAGMGDMILTATGGLSRNRSLGVEVGQGKTVDEVMAGRQTVAEGVNTAGVAVDLAQRAGVELPIAVEVQRILFEGKKPERAIRDLMERELKAELWR
jgi:glycerol-3-phosphate dehydrogenase (NAD(P)+)